jgi:hypothetical protein
MPFPRPQRLRAFRSASVDRHLASRVQAEPRQGDRRWSEDPDTDDVLTARLQIVCELPVAASCAGCLDRYGGMVLQGPRHRLVNLRQSAVVPVRLRSSPQELEDQGVRLDVGYVVAGP